MRFAFSRWLRHLVSALKRRGWAHGSLTSVALIAVLWRWHRRHLQLRLPLRIASVVGDWQKEDDAVPPPPALVEGAGATSRPRHWNPQPPSVDLSSSFHEGWNNKNNRTCRFYDQGCCKFGDECNFRHSRGRNLARGQPKANSKLKKDFCSWHILHLANGCPQPVGECTDAHTKEELLDRRPPALPPFFPSEGLPYFDTHCHLDGQLLARRYGYHWTYKTKLCRTFCENGWCSWGGDKCVYAHGKEELLERPPLRRNDLEDMLQQFPPGFAGLLHNCCDRESVDQTVEIVQWGRELGIPIYASFGCHPSDSHAYDDDYEAKLLDGFERCGDRAIAWGECGLDYYRKTTAEDKVQMKRVLQRQVLLAVEHGLPLIVHSRDAESDTLEVLRECLPSDMRLHLHSFHGSIELLKKFLDEWPRCFVGVNGVVTYPTAPQIADLAASIPLERMLLETDGPFMMPEPFRYTGGGSHAGHIPWIAHAVAAIKGADETAVLARSNLSISEMYGIQAPC